MFEDIEFLQHPTWDGRPVLTSNVKVSKNVPKL
jgi:hypothetical protein